MTHEEKTRKMLFFISVLIFAGFLLPTRTELGFTATIILMSVFLSILLLLSF